ncbi:hypothetical protein AFE_2465 [Acidithiobacillus ferrooxidans ATCC 23270]|uniref:Uncharacterized protein n=1 Tax=Acidithiobacillus ferrooxidans (strain ATCC 23270 / DSM 14882 / CIP 104768 / NCIMB 8455) TaxID=243159 RepID=B7J702_ACIF2|nr:hypothetical protein AFE_2465 [Acidithiobacillus ferrooxidans ATCC 23270]
MACEWWGYGNKKAMPADNHLISTPDLQPSRLITAPKNIHKLYTIYMEFIDEDHLQSSLRT